MWVSGDKSVRKYFFSVSVSIGIQLICSCYYVFNRGLLFLVTLSKGPRKRGNIVAETTLRKHCFLAAQTGKHLLKKQNVSEKSQKHFLFLGSKKCFRNKCFPSAQTGKQLGKQQCFRNNVSSFAGALKACTKAI